jgi:hypothetical protein
MTVTSVDYRLVLCFCIELLIEFLRHVEKISRAFKGMSLPFYYSGVIHFMS